MSEQAAAPAKSPEEIEAEKEIARILSDRRFRINNLYYVEDKNGKKVKFVMTWSQELLFVGFWWLCVILKVRQLGISTFIGILQLDRCLFTPNSTCGIIDKTEEDAKKKLGKISFAYEHMDDPDDPKTAQLCTLLKRTVRLITNNKTEMAFSNGSKIWAGTSLRGGTVNFLHVSELGPIAHKNPAKAKEIAAGSFNTVHQGNIIVVESTHEGGRYGLNYELIRLAQRNNGKQLTKMDWKFFFFPWYKEPGYTLPLNGARLTITPDQAKYFASLEKFTGVKLTAEQIHWYVKKSQTPKVNMAQQFCSTPEEALQAISEGAIYGKEMIGLRAAGRIREFEHDRTAPLYTFWDIGMSDYTCIWLVQFVGLDICVLNGYTCHGEQPSHYAAKMLEWQTHYQRPVKKHFLPHDAAHKIKMIGGKSWRDLLIDAGLGSIDIVPVTPDIWSGIQHLRSLLPRFYFHTECEKDHELPSGRILPSGLGALEGYHTKVDAVGGKIVETPEHDDASHFCDALRVLSEAHQRGMLDGNSTTARDNRKTTQRTAITGLGQPNPLAKPGRMPLVVKR